MANPSLPDDAPIVLTVPYQNRPLGRPSAERVRRLRRHLIEALRDLQVSRRPDRLIQLRPPEPSDEEKAVLSAGCRACQGDCCLGGGDHAWLDERTMARVRRDHPNLNVRGIIAAYVRQVAVISYAGSCLFHGASGCSLDTTLRADLCSTFYCNGLTAFLRGRTARSRGNPRVVIRTMPQRPIAPR